MISDYQNKESIQKLENKVTCLENKISKLEELITLNIKKKYFINNSSYHLDNINYNNEVKIPYLKRMNAFNYSETKYLNNTNLNKPQP